MDSEDKKSIDENFFVFVGMYYFRNMIKTLVVWLLFSGVSTFCIGQQSLLFQKNRFKYTKYNVGDVISFRVKDDERKHTFQIRGFEDTVIVFNNYRINPKEITHMYLDDKTRVWYILRYKYSKLLLIGGVGYFAIDAFNSGEISSNSALVGGSLVSAGILAGVLFKDRIRIKGRKRLVIVD